MVETLLNPAEQILRVVRDSGFSPRGVQETAIDKGLFEGESLMITSPTGSGKTLIGEMAILRALYTGHRGLFIVPLRALAVQIAETIREKYRDHGFRIGVSTGDFYTDAEEILDCEVAVMTYERADSLLRRKSPWMDQVGTVVIDEIQNISDVERGPRLESFIMRLKKSIEHLQIIALSATVGSPDELAEWLDCELIESNERPVPLISRIVVTRSRIQTLKRLVMTTVQGDGQAIVFGRTRRDCENYAATLGQEVVRQLTTREKEELDSELQSIAHFDTQVPSDLRTLLTEGVAYHHAGLSYRVRSLVEHLFRNKMIRVVSATTTLSTGLDLPARTVIIANARSPENHQCMINPNQVHQMLGRAGRPGYDDIGFGVILAGSEGESLVLRDLYFDCLPSETDSEDQLIPKYTRVDSKLSQPTSLAEQLLVMLDFLGTMTLDKMEQTIVANTFLGFIGIRDSRAPMRLFALGSIDAKVALEKHALTDTIRAARQGVLGSVTLRERNDSVVGGIVKSWDGTQYTCRFSARLSSENLIEGPQCSCGNPVDTYGILCSHLVALGFQATDSLGGLADYVIPLSVEETSPLNQLLKLGLVEGADHKEVRITYLGRLINRLYLSVGAAKELLAMLPLVGTSENLLWLLRHLLIIQTGYSLDESFDEMIAGIVSTELSISELANQAEMHEGDVMSILESSRWLVNAISAVATQGGMTTVVDLCDILVEAFARRLGKRGIQATSEVDEK